MEEYLPSLESRIKQLLDAPGYRPLNRREIAARLGLEGEGRRDLRRALRGMETRGEAVCLRKNRWSGPAPSRRVTGVFEVSRQGLGRVRSDETPARVFLVAPADWRHAVHGDRVVVIPQGVRTRRRAGGAAGSSEDVPAGHIARVLDRPHGVVAGTLKRTPYYWYLIPDDPRFPFTVRLRADDTLAGRFVDGHMATVRLDAWDPRAAHLSGAATEVLGAPDRPGADVLCVMRRHGIDESFDSAALAEQDRFATVPSDADREGRRDLRDTTTFTIDPADARDFDDAVSLRPLPGGGWEAGIHIADVSHYVRPGSALDREAAHRGTSVYLVDRTITMLPPHLTADVCSLRPGIDRLCHSVLVNLDAGGCVTEVATTPSVIRSRARLNYEEVQSLIDGTPSAVLPLELRPVLLSMHRMAQRWRRRRLEAGALEFDVPEVRCRLDATGHVIAVERRGSREAYRLIEEFMLQANRAVALRLARSRYPALYRIHEAPDDEQWSRMKTELAEIGVSLRGCTGPAVNAAVESVAGSPIEYPVSLIILRCLKRALYSPRCLPHFGLAFQPYTHFTSPIRRYPDLVVHRLLKSVEGSRPPPYSHAEVEAIARATSRREQEADEAERESVEVKRIAYYRRLMDARQAAPMKAVVVGRIPKGWLVEVPDTLQRGLVAFTWLDACGGGRRDASRRSRRAWTIGSTVEVELARVDAYRRLVDFKPARMEAADGGRRAHRNRHGMR